MLWIDASFVQRAHEGRRLLTSWSHDFTLFLQGFWHLGVENAVKNFWKDPQFCANVGQDRHPELPNSMYGCEVATDIDTSLGGLALARGQTGARLHPVLHPDNSLYVVGEDAFQPFFNSSHSCNVVMMK